MFLITTADERSWRSDDKILFLGEWCKLYSRKDVWSPLTSEILPYHWDDRDKMYRDFQYLTGVYERYLKEISLKLNALHGTDHGDRYWRIVIGPWLRYFADSLFDRYRSLKAAADLKAVTLTHLMPADWISWVPKDMDQFYADQITDTWNHFIYGQIIKLTGMLPYQEINELNNPLRTKSQRHEVSGRGNFLKSNINQCARIIAKKTASIVFVASYFDRPSQTKLQLALHQMPQPSWDVIQVPQEPVDSNKRDQLKISLATNEFENILETMIPRQIPASCVETFKWLSVLSSGHYPDNARVIYTANAHFTDEGFKIWSAGKVEKGAKLVIGQHGGMGSILMSQEEDHQIAISDRFYSWGWSNRDENNIKPLPACKLVHLQKSLTTDTKGKILWVMAALPRYSYTMRSMPIGPQFSDYISSQIAFSKDLVKPAFDLLKIRLAGVDYGWSFAERLKDGGLGKAVQEEDSDFVQSLKNSRLYIGTHNSTTLLEAFVLDHPSLLFWNPDLYEIHPKAQRFYDELREVGILHDTSGSAASMLNKIYDDPLSWWREPARQAAKDRFRDQFAYVSDNWVQLWKKELLSV